MRAIFAFSIFFGIPACTTSLSRTIPLTSLLSRMEVPGFFSTFILSKSTLSFLPSSILSAICFVASTTILANVGLSSETSFEYMLVLAIFVKTFLSLTSIFMPIFCKNSRARSAAAVYPSTITDGCTSLFTNSSAFSNSAPAKTTADVVPSPTSLSTDLATSTIIFAAGC